MTTMICKSSNDLTSKRTKHWWLHNKFIREQQYNNKHRYRSNMNRWRPMMTFNRCHKKSNKLGIMNVSSSYIDTMSMGMIPNGYCWMKRWQSKNMMKNIKKCCNLTCSNMIIMVHSNYYILDYTLSYDTIKRL